MAPSTESLLVHVIAHVVQPQDITWISYDLLSIRPLGTNFSEILIKIGKKFWKKNLNQNITIFVQEIAFKYVCKLSAIEFRQPGDAHIDVCLDIILHLVVLSKPLAECFIFRWAIE